MRIIRWIKQHKFYLAFLTSTLSIYWRILFYGFQNQWDDHWVVMNDYTEGGSTWANLYSILTEFYHGQYSPVNQLYYTVLYAIDGYNPFIYHLGSYLLHLLNVFLVFWILRYLLNQSKTHSATSVKQISFVSALIFGIHPLGVEPISWISASKVPLYTVFYLGAIMVYLKFLHTRKASYYFLVFPFFICSLLAKEQAVTLPVCLILLDYILLKEVDSKSWLAKIPFFAISVAFGIITFLSQAADGEGVLAGERSYSPFEIAVLMPFTLSEYFTKSLFPLNLSYMYPFPFQVGERIPGYLFVYPLLVIVLVYAWTGSKKNKVLFYATSFFLIHLLLVSNILTLSRFAVTADRYAYVGSIGIIFLVAYLYDRKSHVLRKNYAKAFFALYVVALFLFSFFRVGEWKTSDTLKKDFREHIKFRMEETKI